MPLQTIPYSDGWTAGTPETGGTRVEARGTGFYVATGVVPAAGDFSTAIALASGESLFVADTIGFFVHASQPVVPASVYTTGGIPQVTNAC